MAKRSDAFRYKGFIIQVWPGLGNVEIRERIEDPILASGFDSVREAQEWIDLYTATPDLYPIPEVIEPCLPR